MLARSGLLAVMLAACALVDGARAASPASVTERTEAMVGASTETPAINSLSATDALASFISGLAAPGAARPNWGELEGQALARSRTQHAGRPETLRFCEPELKVCNSGIVWKAEDGTRLFLRRAEDMHGEPREREVCEINAFGDVRVCVDWDTNETSRDMKDGKGHWYKVADQ
jgi:hypothetical protein